MASREAALRAAIADAEGWQFAFDPDHDCVAFVARCRVAMGYPDPRPGWKYSNAAEARAALKAAGHATLYRYLKSALGEPLPASFARRGDVVVRLTREGVAVGICEGDAVVFTGEEAGEGGLVRLSRRECHRCWRA